METELRAAHEGDFGARIEPEPDPGPEHHHGFHNDNDSSPVFFQQPPPQYHMMAPPPPQFQSSSKGLFEDEDKMKYIIPIVAFILGFFLSRTMNPIIIRSS